MQERRRKSEEERVKGLEKREGLSGERGLGELRGCFARLAG